MKFSTVATLSLAASSLVAAIDQNKEYTTVKTITTKYNHGKDTYTYTTTSTHTTHKYGKFNKTKKSKKPASSGTHKYGKFNKTKHHSTLSGLPQVKHANAASPQQVNSFQLFGLTAVSAFVTGALLLL